MLFYVICILLLEIKSIGTVFQEEVYGKVLFLLKQPQFYWFFLCCSYVIVVPDISIKILTRLRQKTPLDYLMLQEVEESEVATSKRDSEMTIRKDHSIN